MGIVKCEEVTCPPKSGPGIMRNKNKPGVQWASEVSDGMLFWQPGPGFLGEYQFVIIDFGKSTKKTIKVAIVPARDSMK